MAPSFQLVIENLKKSAHGVPVRLYGQLLDDLQSVIYLLGANVEGIHLSSKGPLPASLVDTYTLEVKAEHAGSFAAEVAFAEPQGLDVFDEPRREVLLQLEHLCRAIANRDNERLYQIIPNALLRRKLLRAFRSLTAQLGRDFSASLQLGESSRRWHFDAEAPQWIDQILTRVSEKSRLEMWGQLIELRVVDEFRFTLLSAGKEIKCSFDEELLENIIPCIGQPVSLTGEGIWSERGLERVVLQGLQRLRPGEVEMSVITCGKDRYYLKVSVK
ncbi:hypothetical protein [Alicyclobacillus macrosporangiidus]|uniref:Uncharacterized protein n=1 Tax=Alicyclobacillus macrosporangiidus TaxID=392015 RepID=A0A1I7LC52_9BACL|nr:hypothetical protein [Alicyclobacillus macrosporangiidus]SFV07275.1 hypothetical protein SAMN05421543_1354 [Alicyclobacillus macrosporangiidus]